MWAVCIWAVTTEAIASPSSPFVNAKRALLSAAAATPHYCQHGVWALGQMMWVRVKQLICHAFMCTSSNSSAHSDLISSCLCPPGGRGCAMAPSSHCLISCTICACITCAAWPGSAASKGVGLRVWVRLLVAPHTRRRQGGGMQHASAS